MAQQQCRHRRQVPPLLVPLGVLAGQGLGLLRELLRAQGLLAAAGQG